MSTIAEFARVRVILSILPGLLFLWAVGLGMAWLLSDPGGPYLTDVLRVAPIVCLMLVALVLLALPIAASFRRGGAAIYLSEGQVFAFDGLFFKAAPVAKILEVKIAPGDLLQKRGLVIAFEPARRIRVPLHDLRGKPEHIRQRLCEAVKEAREQSAESDA